jgi:hypothetical protein
MIEHLDAACVQTACARAGEFLIDAPLDDDNVDARQRQLARQHQPCRTSAGDHHRMLGHRHTPVFLAARRQQFTHFVTPQVLASGSVSTG